MKHINVQTALNMGKKGDMKIYTKVSLMHTSSQIYSQFIANECTFRHGLHCIMRV